MLEPVAFRPLARGDVADVAELEARSFSTPWSERTFASLVDREEVEAWVAEAKDGEIVGYAVAWCVGDWGELANLAVLPSRRGRGVGSTLLDHVLGRVRLRGVREMFLEVRASNQTAARLYQSRGFREIGIRRSYYPNPREDAKVFKVLLEPGGSEPGPSD